MRVKSQVVERGVRAFVSSLLSSEMSAREVRDFAFHLTHDPELARIMGFSLLHAIDPILDASQRRYSEDDNEGLNSELRGALLSRGLTIEEIVRMARAVAPSLAGWGAEKRRSKLATVDSLIAAASERDRRELLRVLSSGGVDQDPFITGLQDREKKS